MAEKVFNKKPAELSAEEKETLRIASMLAGGLVGAVANNNNTNHGANGLARATEGMATAQRAVENNYLHSGEVESLIRELAKAEKEGRDTKPIFEKYARLSEKNRQEILQECGDNPACYIPHMYMMNTGDKEAYENFSGLRFTTYFNGLSAETRAAMHDFVTNENAITRDALPWTIHAGMAALEFGEAIGAGAAIVNGKNLISLGKTPQTKGRIHSDAPAKGEIEKGTSKDGSSLTSEQVPNKPHYTVGKNGKIDYSSSGFDYERRLVGDSDYDMPKKQTEAATANPMDSKPKSSGAENAALYPKLKDNKNVNNRESYSFESQLKLDGHFEKHNKEFGDLYSSPSEYLKGANEVIQNGYKVSYKYKGEDRFGYVQYFGNNRKGESKFAFVGTNSKGNITTYHIESGKDFWKMINGNKDMKVINPQEKGEK